jgi:hypothetical protein
MLFSEKYRANWRYQGLDFPQIYRFHMGQFACKLPHVDLHPKLTHFAA